MLNVIRFNEEFKPIVLECASQAMDLETADVKIAIVSRVVEMDKTDSLVNYIIAKGKVDNNYWVRLVSNR